MSDIAVETAAKFRARALDLLQRAEAASDASSRSIYLELASQWVELAQRFEEWEKSHGPAVQ
jgi:hypothetical protein